MLAAALLLGCFLGGSLPGPAAADEIPAATLFVPYHVEFAGNRFFGETALREAASQELADFEALGQRKAEADDAAFQMELLYRKSGFPFAIVEYNISPDGPAPRLDFMINEGPRTRVNPVLFSGNKAMSSELLRSYFSASGGLRLDLGGELFYVEANVRQALEEIKTHYHAEGYRDLEIVAHPAEFNEKRNRVTLAFTLNEGVRHLVHEVSFSGTVPEEAKAGLASIAAELRGEPYFKRRRVLLRSKVIDLLGTLGYPDAAAPVSEKQGAAPGQVVLQVAIEPGPRVTLAGIEVSGNQRTRESFIANRLVVEEGEVYDLGRMRESFDRLYRTGLFSKVDMSLAPLEEEGERRVMVELEEYPAKELSMSAGWGSYEMLRLGFGYRDRNFRGSGRILRTEGLVSMKGERAVVGFTDPWFLGTEVVADLPFSYQRREEPSFTREEIGSSLLFSRGFGEKLTVTLGYTFRMTTVSDITGDITAENSDSGYNYASIKGQASWDSRDDIFFPTSGAKSFVAAETADAALGSQVGLLRLTTGYRYYRPLSEKLSLGLRYSTGLIVPGRDQVTLPLGEKFFNGGESSVRSFQESSIGPRADTGEAIGGLGFNVLSVELRRRFAANFGATLFADLGNIAPNRSRFERGLPPYASGSELLDTTLEDFFSDLRPAVGLGFLYLLPIGPIRLDFAINPDADKQRNEDDWAMHFSVGLAF